MTRQSRGGNRNSPKGNPNQDVQPWLGWIAALLVVVIVVVAVALGMERTNMQRTGAPEVRMTPLVGGMQMPVSTETSVSVAAAEITPLPADTPTSNVTGTITDTETITMVTVIPVVTESLTDTETLTETVNVTDREVDTETVVTETTVSVDGSALITDDVPSATVVDENNDIEEGETPESAESTPTAVATPRPRPTPRSSPTPQLPTVDRVFAVGDSVVATVGRVEIHADASQESMVLDSFGPGVVLDVIDPSGDYVEYPVRVEGFGWVRVRAADGLVGWVQTDQVEVP